MENSNLNTEMTTDQLINLINFYQKESERNRLGSYTPVIFAGQETILNNKDIDLKIVAGLKSKLYALAERKVMELNLGSILPTSGNITVAVKPAPKERVVINDKNTKVIEVSPLVNQVKDEDSSNKSEIKEPSNVINFIEEAKNDLELREKVYKLYNENKVEAQKIYNKIVNHENDSIKTINSRLAQVASMYKKELANSIIENQKKAIKDANLPTDTTIKNGFTGEELVKREDKLLNGTAFNIKVLTGEDDEDKIPKEDLIILQAKQARLSGQEGIAVDYMVEYLSKVKGIKDVDRDLARHQLNLIMRASGTRELSNAIRALLIYYNEYEGDYKKGLQLCNRILELATRKEDGVHEQMIGDKKEQITKWKSWNVDRINKFIDNIATELGYLEVEEKPVVSVENENNEEKAPENAAGIVQTKAPEKPVEAKTETIKEQPAEKTNEVKAVDQPKQKMPRKEKKALKAKLAEEKKNSSKKGEKGNLPDTQEFNTGDKDGKNAIEFSETMKLFADSYKEHNCITMEMRNILKTKITRLFWKDDILDIPAKNKFEEEKNYIKAFNAHSIKYKVYLNDVGINPLDFNIEIFEGKIIRVYNWQKLYKTKEGNWINENKEVVIAHDNTKALESKNDNAQPVDTTVTSEKGAEKSSGPLTKKEQPNITRNEKGDPIHPATLKLKEQAGKIVVKLQQVANGWKAWLENSPFGNSIETTKKTPGAAKSSIQQLMFNWNTKNPDKLLEGVVEIQDITPEKKSKKAV